MMRVRASISLSRSSVRDLAFERAASIAAAWVAMVAIWRSGQAPVSVAFARKSH